MLVSFRKMVALVLHGPRGTPGGDISSSLGMCSYRYLSVGSGLVGQSGRWSPVRLLMLKVPRGIGELLFGKKLVNSSQRGTVRR